MTVAIIALGAGLLIGWSVPQPKWAAAAVAWVKSKLVGVGVKTN